MSEFTTPEPPPPPPPLPTGEPGPVPPGAEHFLQKPENDFEAEAARLYPDAPRVSRAIYNALAEDVNRKDSVTAGELAASTDLPVDFAAAVLTGMQVRGLVSSEAREDGSFSVIHPPEKPAGPKPDLGKRAKTQVVEARGHAGRHFREFRTHSWIGRNLLLGRGVELDPPARKPDVDQEPKGYPDDPAYTREMDLSTTHPGIVILASPLVDKKHGTLTKYGYSRDPNTVKEHGGPFNTAQARESRKTRENEAAEARKAKREQEARDQLKPDMWEEVLGFVAGKGSENGGKKLQYVTPSRLAQFLADKSGRTKQLAKEAGLSRTDTESWSDWSDEDKATYLAASRQALGEARPFANMFFNRLRGEGIVSEDNNVTMSRKQIKAIRREHRESRTQAAIEAAHAAWEARLAGNRGAARAVIRAAAEEESQREARANQAQSSDPAPQPSRPRPERARQPQPDPREEVLKYMATLSESVEEKDGKPTKITMAEASIARFLARKFGREEDDATVKQVAEGVFNDLVAGGVIKPEMVDRDGKSVSVDRVTMNAAQLKKYREDYIAGRDAPASGTN